MLSNLKADLSRYSGSLTGKIKSILFLPTVWVIISFRIRSAIYSKKMGRVFPFSLIIIMLELIEVIVTNIQIPSSVKIGKGIFIAHTGYIVFSNNVTLGSYCTLTQGVTIGHKAGGKTKEFISPKIGNRVYIGPGAIVIGDIEIGNDSLIGAGAVVTKSFAERSVITGNPAKCISQKGSFDLIIYPGMDLDNDRMESLSKKTSETINNENNEG